MNKYIFLFLLVFSIGLCGNLIAMQESFIARNLEDSKEMEELVQEFLECRDSGTIFLGFIACVNIISLYNLEIEGLKKNNNIYLSMGKDVISREDLIENYENNCWINVFDKLKEFIKKQNERVRFAFLVEHAKGWLVKEWQREYDFSTDGEKFFPCVDKFQNKILQRIFESDRVLIFSEISINAGVKFGKNGTVVIYEEIHGEWSTREVSPSVLPIGTKTGCSEWDEV